MTDKELTQRAEEQLAEDIVKAVPTKGHLATDYPNSVIVTRRELNSNDEPESIYEIYKWDNTYHKFLYIREVFREVDTKKKATLALIRRIDSVINELERLKTYIREEGYEDYVDEAIADARRQFEIIWKSII
jgi:hypothetical protein